MEADRDNRTGKARAFAERLREAIPRKGIKLCKTVELFVSKAEVFSSSVAARAFTCPKKASVDEAQGRDGRLD